MKYYLIFLLLPLKVFCQDVEGVWIGTLYNDTTGKYLPYELVISAKKGKLSGFSHTIFGEKNNYETGVKALKIKKKKAQVFIEDDGLIYNDYAAAAPKGVKQYSILNLVSGDSGLRLIGVFKTNQTKEYASLTGTIQLLKKTNASESKLIPKLDEMNLTSSLSFNQYKPTQKKELPVKSAPSFTQRSTEQITVNTVKNPEPKLNKVSDTRIFSEELAKRKVETIRTIYFTSDSLLLTLYDNGEVDGDTVSILLNETNILSKQRLTAKAITKTIYITPELGDNLQLIMFAENLGSIAPNTGLLIIQDGNERYQIRFEGDLKKNSAIVLRRKRN